MSAHIQLLDVRGEVVRPNAGAVPVAYRPGTLLKGRVALLPLPGEEGARVELAVLWQTEGKGNTDIGVVHYQVLADGDRAAAVAEHSFEVQLPILPLTYHGQLIKIGWCVRVRRLKLIGDDVVIDEPFDLTWGIVE